MRKFVSNYLKDVSITTVVLPPGTIVTDETSGKLYVHDGVTPGGISTGGVGSTTTVTPAATAIGTNQNTAVPISKTLTVFTTVASGTGTVLPATPLNVVFTIVNRGANTLLVYPPLGAKIEGNSTNAAVSISSGATANFILISATQIYAY